MILNYSRFFLMSSGLHLGLLCLLFINPHSSTQAVLEAQEYAKTPMEMAKSPENAPILAVAVNASEVAEAMEKLQFEREQAKRQEQARLQKINDDAARAKAAKIAEMKRLQALQAKAKELALKQTQMENEAKKHLEQLAIQKQVQEKQLAEMKIKQDIETKRLAELEKQKQAEIAKAAEKKAQSLALAQRQAGEVNKYKALILNAIRDRWILPEHIDPGLSSQFAIRLAPTGAVLDVRLTRSSGDPILDRTAQAAIYKASPLPVPVDPVTFGLFREISLTVRPSVARG